MSGACLLNTSSSVQETVNIGDKFVNELPSKSIIALKGDLGAGKTHFVKGIAKGMGIVDTITSPTYNLYNLYESTNRGTLLHLDAYRLESEEDAEDLLLEDFLGAEYILVIEWPEKISRWIPENSIWIEIKIIDQNERLLQTVPASKISKDWKNYP